MKTYTHIIQQTEADKRNITQHTNYVKWMEDARNDYLEQLGWTAEKIEQNGIVPTVIAIECKFWQPSFVGEEISIHVEPVEYAGRRLRIKYIMNKPNGSYLCEAISDLCFFHADGSPVRLNKEFPEFYATIISAIKKGKD